MKTIKPILAVSVGLLFASTIRMLAIENLKISVECSNVVLSWPSAEGETYIVQYRQTLDATDSWQTLTSSLPANVGTNITVFIHPNIVQHPNCGGGGSFNSMAPNGNTSVSTAAVVTRSTVLTGPLVMRADDLSSAAPLCLYPPGFDLSGFIIFDPVTGESVDGSKYTTSPFSLSSLQLDVPQPLDGGSGTGGTDPATETGFYQVVRKGVHLIGITNVTTLSGVVTIPVEAGNDSGSLANLCLSESDSPVGNSIQTAPFGSALALTVDTTQMGNGVHLISASARWDILGGTNDENGGEPTEADSPPVTVNIYNEISFPNWMPEFGELGDSLLIRATSAHANADWYIDVYDSQYSYIGTFGGHTDDGDIAVAWNLIGPDGAPHTNDNFFEFVVTTVFEDPEVAYAATPPIYKHLEKWSGHGAWVVVAQHAWDTWENSELLYAELNGFISGAQGVGWPVLPSPVGGDAFALGTGCVNCWSSFRAALYNPQTRNVVYFGHGGPDGLGYNPANTNLSISANEIGNMLHTIPPGQTNRHSFRFAFLDGCSTAKGTLPAAFGMFNRENVQGWEYADASMRPSAFVGWPKDKVIGLGGGYGIVNLEHINFITYIQMEMLGTGYSGYPQPIKPAIYNASYYPGISTFGPNSLIVYGYWDLGLWQYND